MHLGNRRGRYLYHHKLVDNVRFLQELTVAIDFAVYVVVLCIPWFVYQICGLDMASWENNGRVIDIIPKPRVGDTASLLL